MTMLDLYNISRDLARSSVVQNSETDGFAVCLICGTETDPQTFNEQGSEHAYDCIVGKLWRLVGESDRGPRAVKNVEVQS